jgi:hypothetical protein
MLLGREAFELPPPVQVRNYVLYFWIPCGDAFAAPQLRAAEIELASAVVQQLLNY